MSELMNNVIRTGMVLVTVLALSNSAQAATSENLNLSGSVASILSIAVSANATASGLGLTSSTAGSDIGVVTETCNDADGYTVSVTSANGVTQSAANGVLIGGSHSETLSYSLTYNSSAVTFVNGVGEVTNVNEKTAAGGVAKTVQIIYDPTSSNLAADSYSDTLTFSIAAK